MRPTLQPRLQGSFKHGDRRRFHSMIMQEFVSQNLRMVRSVTFDQFIWF